MCGGRAPAAVSSSTAAGSSPRVRGTPIQVNSAHALVRIIPACAGDAKRVSNIGKMAPDHPRVCGGRFSSTITVHYSAGSSPRVRGTRALLHVAEALHRIIPACAGDASCLACGLCGIADHPRVCGGRTASARVTSASSGSSPRVRGTPLRSPPRLLQDRIIPACAGDACDDWRPAITAPDHPRVCGGRWSRDGTRARAPGSSPRVRGTRARSFA